MSEPTTLPCPFCGSKERYRQSDFFFVQCLNCGASGPCVPIGTPKAEARIDAIDLWNDRDFEFDHKRPELCAVACVERIISELKKRISNLGNRANVAKMHLNQVRKICLEIIEGNK